MTEKSTTATSVAFKGVTPFLKTKDLAKTIDFYYGRREFAIKDCNGYLLTFSEPASSY